MKTGLVISGGGSRGAFAVGALKYLLREQNLRFDVLSGTSTGALITPMIAARGVDALDTLEREYTSVRTEDILGGNLVMRVLAGEPSFHNTKPLRRRIEANLTDEVFKALQAAPRQLAITTVDLRDGALVYHQTGKPIATSHVVMPITSRLALVEAALASASIPVAMEPVRMARDAAHPGDFFVDGGVRDYAPVGIVIDAGAEDITCIVLAPEGRVRREYTKTPGNVMDVLQRAVDLLSQEVGEGDLRMSQVITDAVWYQKRLRARLEAAGVDRAVIQAAEAALEPHNPFRGRKAISLRIIRPERPLLGDTLKFSPEEMKANLDYGYECARRQWDRPRPLDITGILEARPAVVDG